MTAMIAVAMAGVVLLVGVASVAAQQNNEPSATRSFNPASVAPGGTVTVTIQVANYGGRELSRTGLARVCGDLRLSGGWVGRRRCRQAGSGMARSRAKARLNFSAQGQRSGRCRVNRRAERVSRPAREKNRRRRVLVVAIRSPRPIRAVQWARLWAITCTASQAPLAAKRPEGRWFSPTPYLRSRMAFSISAWRRWSASSSSNSPSRSVMKP